MEDKKSEVKQIIKLLYVVKRKRKGGKGEDERMICEDILWVWHGNEYLGQLLYVSNIFIERCIMKILIDFLQCCEYISSLQFGMSCMEG